MINQSGQEAGAGSGVTGAHAVHTLAAWGKAILPFGGCREAGLVNINKRAPQLAITLQAFDELFTLILAFFPIRPRFFYG